MDNITAVLTTNAMSMQNVTEAIKITPACYTLLLNVVIPMVSVIVFVVVMCLVYFIDDPDLREMKTTAAQVHSRIFRCSF